MKIKSVQTANSKQQTATKLISILSLLVLSQACNPSGGAKKKDNTLLYGALAVSAAQASAPAITSFTPLYGGVGTTVTVKGKNLTSVTKVTLDSSAGLIADVISAASETLTFKVPTNSNSSFTIKIGDSSAKDYFYMVDKFWFSKTYNAATQNSTNLNISAPYIGYDNVNISSFTSSPSLPTGLNLNSTTGAITGIPTGTTGNAYTTYTISAILNNESSVKATGSIQILVATSAETTARTCNTTGVFSGCTAQSPYSCTNNSTCYGGTDAYSRCVSSTACGF